MEKEGISEGRALVVRTRARLTKPGIGGRDNNHFMAEGWLTPDELHTIQRELGFDPRGYDLYGIRATTDHESGKKITTWKCYGSCD